jgi:hypothetical protein
MSFFNHASADQDPADIQFDSMPANQVCHEEPQGVVETPSTYVTACLDGSPAAETTTLTTGIPAIVVTGRPFRFYAEEAAQALTAHNDPPTLYRRSGRMVKVTDDDAGRPTIQFVGRDELCLLLSHAADFYRATGLCQVHVAPPQTVVNSVLTRRDLSLPVLVGITECPVLRRDGTVLQTPGYDETTRLLYRPAPGLELPSVSLDPSAHEVHNAVALLEEAIGDFPFEDQASKANAIALLLTAPVRSAVEQLVPMAVISATNPGAGKGLLANIAAVIATGSEAAVEGAPSADEEFRKKITALLRAGRQFIVWDNVRGTLQSTALEAVLTACNWSDRLLGTNENLCFPQRSTWVATGNNISLGTDLARRCYQIRFISSESRPWEREDFKHPELLCWVAQHRGELLAALLTLSRAWFAAGCPEAHLKAFGSFEQWSQVVGGILENAGIQGFLGNRNQMLADTDEEDQQWSLFLAALKRHFRGKSFTIAQLVQATTGHAESKAKSIADTLPAAFLDTKHGRQHQLLGKAFSSRLKTKYGPAGLYLDRDGNDSHTKAARWCVRFIQDEQHTGIPEAA